MRRHFGLLSRFAGPVAVAVLFLTLGACGTDKPSNTSPAGIKDVSPDLTDDAQIGDAEDVAPDVGIDVKSDAKIECTKDADCTAPTAACQAAKCSDNKCTIVQATDGSTCNDGLECTTGDVCASGVCKGKEDCTKFPAGDPKAGQDIGQCFTGSCGDGGKCQFAKLVGTPCDDGDACTNGETCNVGSCTSGVPVDCNDDKDCTVDSCSPTQGCVHTAKAAGTACTTQGDLCHTGQQCEGEGAAVQCAGGVTDTCDDSNTCTTDACVPATGCKHTPKNNGAICDDGDLCTQGDTCAGTSCKGAAKSCDDSNGCTTDQCDAKTGTCNHISQTNTSCDDGKPCTKSDLCSNGTCAGTALLCNDGNACTSDNCDPKTGNCAYLPLADGATCTDLDQCTTGDKCVAGACKGFDWQATGQCDDKNACTTDGCQKGGGCIHIPADGKGCDDGQPCTTLDKCAGTTCKGAAKDCADTNKCTADSCDVASGLCKHDQFIGPCEDGNKCTTNDQCQDGLCNGPPTDCNDGNSCTNDICDTVKGCTHKLYDGGTACDDGLPCTIGDKCDGGQCVPTTNKCTACTGPGDVKCQSLDDGNVCNGLMQCLTYGTKQFCGVAPTSIITCDGSKDNACSKNTCDQKTGNCAPVVKNEGTPCLSGSKCFSSETCAADGTCKGIALDCDDNEPCTVDACDALQGCTHKALSEGAPCDDGNSCTAPDFCKAGKCGGVSTCNCVGDADCVQYDDGNLCNGVLKCSNQLCVQAPNSVVTCPALVGQPCKTNACIPATGLCEAKAKADELPCTDSNACTVGDACTGGACVANKTLNCDDSNKCTVDVCDPVFGCAHAALSAGALCDDANACTKTDSCIGGVCAGKPLNCDDANACTIDLCTATGGCTSIIDDSSPCSDGDACTLPDACTDGVCKGVPMTCDDNNPCTADACDGKGGCKNVVRTGNCDDGDLCTEYDACVASVCIGKARSCDDGNPCTDDSCTLGACVSYPAMGKKCDDGNACTSGDACDIQAACAGTTLDCTSASACVANLGCSPVTGCITAPNDGKPCSDNDMCTLGDKCAGGICAGTALDCNDNNVCTSKSCDPKAGCVIKNADCDDKNDCTLDGCKAGVGCTHENVDGQTCEDGDLCTIKGKCAAGTCTSQPQVCDDTNPCTVDSCDSKTGCTYLPAADTAATCDDGDACTIDACHNGACVPTPKICDDGNPCTIDMCDAQKGCITSDKPDGGACDDKDDVTCDYGSSEPKCVGKAFSKCMGGLCGGGYIFVPLCSSGKDSECDMWDDNNKCNGTLKCVKKNVSDVGGICRSQPPVVCPTLKDTPCNKNTCQVLTGACTMQDLVNDSKCDDGKGCTAGDHCTNGTCVPLGPTDCSAKADQCNDAKCNEDSEAQGGYVCVALPKAGTPVCDADGDGCTTNDSCVAGKCEVGSAIDCSGIAGPCQVSTCKSTGPMAFTCLLAPQPDAAPCDDHQLCTEGDACKSGKCVPGTKPHDCSAYTNTCATGTCNKTANGGQGACIGEPQAQGQPCDADDNGCTVGDTCINGMCIPGGPPDCSNLTAACAIGACKSTGADVHQCLATPRPDTLPCEADENGCTVGDACKGGKCTPGPQKICTDLTSSDGCLVGTCKSNGNSDGQCYAVAAPVGQLCDSDHNGCTKGDACNVDGACLPGPAVDCVAYSGSCTVGFCQSSGPTTFSCDGNPKTDNAVCDADGNGCTVNDKCKAGKCTAGAPVVCPGEPGPCLAEVCTSKSSDTFQCGAQAATPGQACDADANGCTVADSCQNGSCTPGTLEMCTQFWTECGTASCNSTGAGTFTCAVAAKISYPPIDVTCTPSAVPTTCPAGYSCFQDDKTGVTGHCQANITVACDDKNGCTVADYCFSGACVSGSAKNCDDDDPCTLDSCAANACVNAAIAGCNTCAFQKFDAATLSDGAVVSTDAAYAQWKLSDAAPWAGMRSLHAEWQGPNAATFAATTRYLHRKIFIDSGSSPTLDFRVAMTVGDAGCGTDDLTVTVNGNVAWQQCDSVTSPDFNNFKHISVDLAKYEGAPADIEFRVTAGVGASSGGSVDIDNVRVTGACGNDCLGADFEKRMTTEDPDAVPNNVVPQPWQFSPAIGTPAAYVQWAVNETAGHTGNAELQAVYSGAPASGTAQTAKFIIPSVRPTSGDKLRFALRVPSVGDAGCGNDDFTLRIAGTQIFQQCAAQTDWLLKSIDLTPYAGQTIDIEFAVSTGGTAAAQGKFELDDIAVQGNCSYACFQENFDSDAGLAKWTASSSDALKLMWKLGDADASSPPYSVYMAHDNTPKDNAVAYLTAKSSERFTLSVLGATFKYAATVFLKNATCPADNIMALRLVTMPSQGATLPALATDGNVTLKQHCASSDGWQAFDGSVDAAAWGRDVTPSLTFGKLPTNTASTAYVDDITLMCK